VGTVLERLYKGTILQVTVLENGFEFNGTTHKSISKLAQVITGAQAMNGYQFFKLGVSTEKKARTGSGSANKGTNTAALQAKIDRIETLIGKLKTALDQGFDAVGEAQVKQNELKAKMADLNPAQGA